MLRKTQMVKKHTDSTIVITFCLHYNLRNHRNYKECKQMAKILSEEQMSFYREHDYVLVKNVIPQETLDLSRKILSRWIDDHIVKWYAEEKLETTLQDV